MEMCFTFKKWLLYTVCDFVHNAISKLYNSSELSSYFRQKWCYQIFMYIEGQIYFLGAYPVLNWFPNSKRTSQSVFSNGKLGFQIQVRLSWSRATLNVCICAFSCIGILQKSMYQRYQKGTPILLSCGPFWGSTETMITRTFTWNTREMYFCLCVSLAYSQSWLVTS